MVRDYLYSGCFSLLALTINTSAQASGSDSASPSSAPTQQRKGPPMGPPPEAIAACNGKTAGVEVSFTGIHGNTMTGVCELIGGKLTAMPNRSKPLGAAQ